MGINQKTLPGILLCAILAIPCWLLGQQFHLVGSPIFAIILGIIIGSIFTSWKREKTGAGIGFTSKKILQWAVILLGFGLNITQILHVGWISLPVIISTIATSLIVSYVIYRLTHIDSNSAVLIGVGSSICGGSAIAAAAPVIKAEDHDIAQAISVVFFFNVVAAFVFPQLGDAIGLSNMGFGLFAGTAVNDTSSVTATAAVWDSMKGTGTQVLEYATIVKLTRTLAIIPICLGLASYQVYKAKKNASQTDGANVSIAKIFPRFVLYFVLCSLVTTALSYANVDIQFLSIFKTISKYFITMAMVAIGLNTNIVKLLKSGGSALALGACCWIAISAVSLMVQHMIGLW
ncbi:YeiH family protein [uncultured Veillonella sp.]|uniref:YeiH family protein n=1 Tax=uncultured Veillonella sp. TaxID=159268 RepID=UPI0025FDD364|nr:YeiH family protein [uncultured Veillonella sp.]